MTDEPPTFLGIAHVAFKVGDVARSAAWYRDTLGFGEPRWAGAVATLAHRDSKLLLVLLPKDADAAPVSSSGYDHVALRVPDRATLDAWEARLTAAGVGDGIHDNPVVGASIDLVDPDGNAIELICPPARA